MTTETVADVLADFDAMAAECGGLEAATIHAMTTRLSVANAREVARAVANERVRDVHTCHGQCTKTELCRMTRRAGAAEAACADAAVVIRHAQLHECGRWPGLLKALDNCAAKSAAIDAAISAERV